MSFATKYAIKMSEFNNVTREKRYSKRPHPAKQTSKTPQAFRQAVQAVRNPET